MDGLVKRTAYGFATIQEALSQLFTIHTSLNTHWEDIVKKLYETHANEFLLDADGIKKSLLYFSPVIGGSLFIPTDAEKEYIGLDPHHPCRVWVSLFSPLIKPLIVNGVYVLREAKKTR
jgi:hypothetical protein